MDISKEARSEWRRGLRTIKIPCIKCRKPFKSEGASHRYCPSCDSIRKKSGISEQMRTAIGG